MKFSIPSSPRILVIKLRHLGDVLLSTPVFSTLKKEFPQSDIDAYVWKEAKGVLEGHPAIRNILCYDRAWKKWPWRLRIGKELSLLKTIALEKYDIVLNLTEGDRGALCAFLSRASIKVGIDPRSGRRGMWGKRRCYTHLIKPCPTPRHSVEKDLDGVRVLQIFPKEEDKAVFIDIPSSAKEAISTTLGLHGVSPKEYVVIHGVSRWKFKCPPPSLLAEVAASLSLPVIATGTESEREEVEKIVALAKQRGKKEIYNLAGKTSFKEMGALIEQSAALITVDSVSLHLASAFKTPVVALFGPTSELNWGPWQHPYAAIVTSSHSCRPCRLDGCGGSKRSECLWGLSPSTIVEKCRILILQSDSVRV